MKMLVWIFRLLLLVIVIRMVMRLLSRGSATSQVGSSGAAARVPERAGGELVRDPQCGTYVPKSRALAVTLGGATQYFCSPECRDAYALAARRA